MHQLLVIVYKIDHFESQLLALIVLHFKIFLGIIYIAMAHCWHVTT